eukprot:scaffold203842_cov41-Tisochrysis_lutea.AAC.2
MTLNCLVRRASSTTRTTMGPIGRSDITSSHSLCTVPHMRTRNAETDVLPPSRGSIIETMRRALSLSESSFIEHILASASLTKLSVFVWTGVKERISSMKPYPPTRTKAASGMLERRRRTCMPQTSEEGQPKRRKAVVTTLPKVCPSSKTLTLLRVMWMKSVRMAVHSSIDASGHTRMIRSRPEGRRISLTTEGAALNSRRRHTTPRPGSPSKPLSMRCSTMSTPPKSHTRLGAWLQKTMRA